MTQPIPHSSARMAVVICVAATLALAVAMGVGRFAFTPLFPLMVRDGLLEAQLGAWLAASNYLGYLVGAMVAAYVRLKPATLLALGLLCTVVVTAAMGWTTSSTLWLLLRFVAGVMSAWTLVATSAWGLRWLAELGRPQWAGIIYAGVGTGIAAAGLFCLWAATPETSSADMWVDLGAGAAVVASVSLLVSWKFHTPVSMAKAHTSAQADNANVAPSAHATGLIVCYTLFGFGYILPATYLPALARQLVDDPHVFGLAWPLFGAAAAVSTLVASWGLGHLPRIRIWAVSQGLMALGVWLPSVWPSLASISVAALLVGGTFMVITMLAMQEARARSDGHSTALLGQMTAGFALGQLLGPLVSAGLAGWVADYTTALHHGLWLSAAGLLGSAVYLWRK
jgi:MFS family permease